ncbi:MAG: NHLP bacteriocin export ABC transporter permease/ATPase subunit [Planctomycetota bacterium]
MVPTNDSSLPADSSRETLQQRFGSGERIVCPNTAPLVLDDPSQVYWVESGNVDLFLRTLATGGVDGTREPFLSVTSGSLIFGLGHARGRCAIAAGIAQTVLRAVPIREAFPEDEDVLPPIIQTAIEKWLFTLTEATATPAPDEEITVISGALDILKPQPVRIATRFEWLGLKETLGELCGLVPISAEEPGTWLPVSRRQWLRMDGGQVRLGSASEALGQGRTAMVLPAIHRRYLRLAAAITEQREQAARERVRHRHEHDASRLLQACRRLGSLLGRTAAVDTPLGLDPVARACAIAADTLGVEIGAARVRTDDPRERVQRIAARAGVPCREVILSDGWWRDDNGTMIGFRGDASEPWVLRPTKSGRTELVDPVTDRAEPLNEERASELQPRALSFSRPLPNVPSSGRQLVRFALKGSGRDVWRITVWGIVLGLTGFFAPWATGQLVDQIIPGAERVQLLHLAIGLVGAAVASAAFRIGQGRALLRVQSRAGFDLQTAVWDRLFKLPVGFFQRYSAGDLTQRCLGVDETRQMLSTTITGSLLSAIFGMSSLLLLWMYSGTMTLVAIGLLAVAIGFIALCGLAYVRLQRPLMRTQGRMTGLLLQLFDGIAKLRVAGAENRAFSKWSEDFGTNSRLGYQSAQVRNRLELFQDGFPVIATGVLFAIVVKAEPAGFSIGDYVGFTSAFMGLLGSILAAGSLVVPLLAAVPLFDRLLPVLKEEVEIEEHRTDPGVFTGRMAVQRISFAYSDEGPTILHDVSFEAEPGEFVAIVGPSGSGKSTLFRLLLGFEEPATGVVLYDGQDLSQLDTEEVRRQLGVVLQHGQLLPGDVYTNIVGTSASLTLDDAWEAARMAGFEDDVKSLPMGMQTVITDGGGGLSGGQQQRLRIARALVHKPKILLFDEATSALDNRTQEIVTESVSKLQATRIVIAHRLSTIRDADKIIVLEQGKIVESGGYDDLMKAQGMFYRLAKRQLVDSPKSVVATGAVRTSRGPV